MKILPQVFMASIVVAVPSHSNANGVPDCRSVNITPEFTHVTPPIFPRTPGRAKTGYVVVEFTIQSDGRLTDIEVIDSDLPRYYDRSAKSAVATSRAKPVATGCRYRRRVEYKLID